MMRRFTFALALAITATAAAQDVSSGPCPISAGRKGVVPPAPHIFGGPVWHGEGPVYVGLLWASDDARFSLTRIPIESGMRRAKTAWVAAPGFSGQIEIQGRSLRPGGQQLRFGHSGAVPAARMTLTAPNASGEWSFWPTSMLIPGPGCYAIEIQTRERVTTVVFEALEPK